MSDEDRAAEIVADCLERRERGEQVQTSEVLRRHPELAGSLRRAFDAARRLDTAHPRAPPRPSRVGRTLGPFRLDAELGTGGMGTVWRATLAEPFAGLDAGARVAVKALHPHLAARHDAVARFLREARIGRAVLHENVVQTLGDAEVEDGGERVHLVVMEHVEGRTLRDLLDELGRLPEELCRHAGREAAKALAAIHAAGAVHRDVKPENILITQEQRVKVSDLGVARLLDESIRVSQAGAFVGSVRYAAPEQFGAPAPRSATSEASSAKGVDAVDGRADLYALGLTLYELATGTHPFAGEEFHVVLRKQIHDVPRPAGELNPQLSPFFEDLLARLVEKDRAKRIASAAELVSILERGEDSPWWRERSLALRAATRRPLRRIRIPRETALHGRETELARLRALFDRAAMGEGQVLLVEGEAGIGKSRLVDEFVGTLAQAGEDVNFLFGSYPPGGAATASGAFSMAYREHLGDDPEVLRAALTQTPLLVPAFAALLRGDATPGDAEPLTKDSLQTVFVHATRSFAAERPTIVLIDDLHFAPEEGRALFASLALAVPGHRILLVGCARPDLDERWSSQLAARPQTTRLQVPRLGPKELVRLLRDALGSERLADGLSELIAEKSDGNPFFVFELLRGLREGQFLRRRPDGTWETSQVIRDIRVPSSIAELVQARVADLVPEDKNLLDVGACCGFEFDPLVVAAALAADEIAVLQRLARIEKKHRLVRSAGRRFVFDHHQVQEALSAGLPEVLRERYHGAIADAIETRSGAAAREPKDVEGATCVELAEHFLRGGCGPRALRYLDRAFAHLVANCLHEAAVRLADRALDVADLVEGTARCDLMIRRAARLGLLGRPAEEETTLSQAVALADAANSAGLRARSRTALGWSRVWRGRHGEAQRVLEEALEIARTAGDAHAELQATSNLGQVAFSAGRQDEARERWERCLSLALEAGDRMAEASALGNVAGTLYSLGFFEEARLHSERSLAIHRELGNLSGQAAAAGGVGIALQGLGDLEGAFAHSLHALNLARQTGDRRLESNALVGASSTLQILGRIGEALALAESALALCREIDYPRGTAIQLVNIGPMWCSLGCVDRAAAALEESLSICRAIGSRYPEGYALNGLAAVASARGDPDRAARLFEEALELRRSLGHSDGVMNSLMELGELRRTCGDAGRARAALEEGVALARELRNGPAVAYGLAVLACLPGGDVAAALEAFGGLVPRLPALSQMHMRFLLWQATRDPAHLAEAKRVLDRFVEHAPEEHRASMLGNVCLYRQIAEASA